MNGLKRVRERRDDALTQVNWQQLELLLAGYYRDQGYEVEHVGTGATGARSDGGIDLKLRRADEYVLVQVKHWNAYQVPHNDVHQLLGLMVNEGATGAVLITSGEFTKAAIEAATRQGHVQLIDGDELRALLGPLPVEGDTHRTPTAAWHRQPGRQGNAYVVSRRGDVYEAANGLARVAGERLLNAAEDRTRHVRSGPVRRPGVSASLDLLLFKLAIAAVMMGVLFLAVKFAMDSLRSSLAPPSAARPAAVVAPLVPVGNGEADRVPRMPSGHVTQATVVAAPQEPTAAEIRESQRKADEAMRILEASTPEM